MPFRDTLHHPYICPCFGRNIFTHLTICTWHSCTVCAANLGKKIYGKKSISEEKVVMEKWGMRIHYIWGKTKVMVVSGTGEA